MTGSLQLPDGALLLHIGPQKTGSTAIQAAMHLARETLADHGVLYPGTKACDHEAGWSVMGVGAAIGQPAPRPESWDRLVSEIRESTLPRACLSNEDLSRADDAAVERIVSDLGSERIHLVFVARRLDKLLPSHWQQRLKAKMTFSFDEFLDHVLAEPARSWETKMMWESQDVGAVIERWGRHVPTEQMSVVVADESDRTQIPRAFEAMLGLPDGLLVAPQTRSNVSMTYTETEAVRRLNQLAVDDRWTPEQYWHLLQAGIVQALSHTQLPDEPRINGLPAWAFELVAERASAQAAAITTSGAQVIGDPAQLLIRDHAEPVVLPEPVESVPLDLVADIVRGAVSGAERLHRRELKLARRKRPRRAGQDLSGRELVALLRARVLGRLRRS